MKSSPRMTCGRFLQLIRQESAYDEELGRRQVMEPWYRGDELQLTFCHDKLSPRAAQRSLQSKPRHAVDLISTWFRAQIATSGPKIFRPSLKYCLAMEQIAPPIPVSDYAQPFPVMIVEPPDSYKQLRTTPTNTHLFVGAHSPEFVLVGLLPSDPPTLAVQVVFSSGNKHLLEDSSVWHAETSYQLK